MSGDFLIAVKGSLRRGTYLCPMGKRALIIGASSGLGRCLAERLAADGWTVGLAARREPLLREIAAARPGAFRYAVADVTLPEKAVPALEGLSERMGGFDLCIVTAGAGELNPGSISVSNVRPCIPMSWGGRPRSAGPTAVWSGRAVDIWSS